MYVREAHPVPESAPCGSTVDMGWSHASANTRSSAERAQRARWLANDFNLNFPWIIDDMDDTMHSDFWPFGFYVGWLVDCDGTVLLHEPWGWSTPATQWCELPLADFDDLEAYLDAYLASPPPCYRGVEDSPNISIVPAAAHTKGIAGSKWATDLSIDRQSDRRSGDAAGLAGGRDRRGAVIGVHIRIGIRAGSKVKRFRLPTPANS